MCMYVYVMYVYKVHIMDFNGNQTVQGSKDSFSANCSKGFK